MATLITEDGNITICDGCRDPIDENAPETIHAVELREVRAMGSTEYVEGFRAVFHLGCFPDGRGWRVGSP